MGGGGTGSQPTEQLFSVAHLSAVTGLRLADGRAVVVKARGNLDRAQACVAGQAALQADGFPCPKPLTAVEAVGDLAVHVEEYVPGGQRLLGTSDAVTDSFAALLAELIERSKRLDLPRPRPSPMWLAWDHDGSPPWPPLEEEPPFANAIEAAPWLTDVVDRLHRRLARSDLDEIVGHGDWETQNMAWHNEHEVHVVHDWDSLTTRPEAALAGAAAATFPSGDQPVLAPVEASERLMATYQEAAGRTFTQEETEVAWAAGLWLAAHNARMELLYDRPLLAVTAVEAQLTERLRRAGA